MRFTKLLSICLLLIMLFSKIKAQENVTIKSSVDTIPEKYDKMLKYFVLDKTEVTQLFKIDLIQIARFRLNINYERRLSRKTTIEFETLGTIYDMGQRDEAPERFYMERIPAYYFYIGSLFKYYYNIDRRKRFGKNTNGFSAGFFLISVGAHCTFYDKKDCRPRHDGYLQVRNHNGEFNEYTNDDTNPYFHFGQHQPKETAYYVKPGFGGQRRIGNIGFVSADFRFGVGYNQNFDKVFILPELNIKAGFAFQSFRKRR